MPNTIFSPEELATVLEPDEQLIWQGRPVANPPTSIGNFWLLFGGIFGLVGAVFVPVGVFVDQPVIRIVFTAIGLLFLAIAAAALILPRRFATDRLKRARYALTDRRAIVADGARIRSWPITPDLLREFDSSSPGSLVFAQEPTDMVINGQPVLRDIGFLNIAEAPELGLIIRRILSDKPQS